MGSLIKLVYVLIVLSIAADFINLGGDWFNTNPNGGEISVRSSSLFLPGADGSLGKIVKAAVYLTKSAIKAAKRHAKNQAKARGNARNKARRSQGGSGKWHLSYKVITVEPLLWDTSIKGHYFWSQQNAHIIFVFTTSMKGMETLFECPECYFNLHPTNLLMSTRLFLLINLKCISISTVCYCSRRMQLHSDIANRNSVNSPRLLLQVKIMHFIVI